MNNYEERENNIINGINKLAEMNRTLRLQCKSFIRDFVKEYGKDNGDGSFTLNLYDDEVGEYLGERISVVPMMVEITPNMRQIHILQLM